MVGQMILMSARDKMKRTGRCSSMHDVESRLSRILREKDPENGRVRVSAKKLKNELWKRMPCTKSRLHDHSIHVKRSTARKSCQPGQAGKRAVMFKSVAHAASTRDKQKYGSCRLK